MVNSSIKQFDNPVLGYATPWNPSGFQKAIDFGSKLDMISPVWFQIKAGAVRGDYPDKQWIQKVSSKILPRIVLEDKSQRFLEDLMHNGPMADKLIQDIVEKSRDFDGFVLELLIPQYLGQFLEQLGKSLHQKRKILVIAVMPPDRTPPQMHMFDNNVYKMYQQFVDYFSVMTYDFSMDTGPNAPIEWVKDQIQQICKQDCQQVLMGVPFYGYDYGPTTEPIVGSRYLEVLEKHKPEMEWHQKDKEHSFKYLDHTVYYPTLDFVQARVDLARELGCGIAIWELGQGLDTFFESL
ncbi:glycoside hydrolase superfamily [Gorgonomyces haynaldii]|nr:glycoside hydrolase superfamily [Gorgonomyces haynaldii]